MLDLRLVRGLCVPPAAWNHGRWPLSLGAQFVQAHWSVRFFLMLCNSIANLGSIFQWCRDHRVHHKFMDTPADPHNSTRGFFYAYIGWMLLRKDPQVIEAGKKLNYDDLWADWKRRGMQCFAAHVYGYYPRDYTKSPIENWLLAIFAIGEGWHNWHVPYDYAASELGSPRRFNPTRVWIDMLAGLGLLMDRRRITPLQDKLLRNA